LAPQPNYQHDRLQLEMLAAAAHLGPKHCRMSRLPRFRAIFDKKTARHATPALGRPP
jgi:hypothetical protein